MTKIAKVPAIFESGMSAEEFEDKVKEAMTEQAEDEEASERGRLLYLWEKSEKGEYIVKLYHSYKHDMCDTAFRGKAVKGLSGSQLEGEFYKPGGVWAIFWVIIGIALIAALVFGIAIIVSEEPELGLIPILLLLLVPVAFVEVNLLMFDKKRLKLLNGYLREFTAANNIDIISEELEDGRD